MKNWYMKNGEYEVNIVEGNAYLIKKLDLREPIIPSDAIPCR